MKTQKVVWTRGDAWVCVWYRAPDGAAKNKKICCVPRVPAGDEGGVGFEGVTSLVRQGGTVSVPCRRQELRCIKLKLTAVDAVTFFLNVDRAKSMANLCGW